MRENGEGEEPFNDYGYADAQLVNMLARNDIAHVVTYRFVEFVATLPPKDYGKDLSLSGLFVGWAYAEGDNNGFDACGGNRDLYRRVFLYAISHFEIDRVDFGAVGERVKWIMSQEGHRVELIDADQWSILAYERSRRPQP